MLEMRLELDKSALEENFQEFIVGIHFDYYYFD
jgi:hypothetical protein